MKQEVCDVMRECYSRGWITTRDGNCSVRYRGREYMYITPSGHRKNVLDREDLVKIDFQGSQVIIPVGTKPSGELHMHYLLQKDGFQTRTVLHAHPTHVIAAMYRGFNLPQAVCKCQKSSEQLNLLMSSGRHPKIAFTFNRWSYFTSFKPI